MILRVLTVVAAYGLCLPGEVRAEDPARPNILFLLADDWRWDTLGCETEIVQTPHLDQLAKEGLRFTQCRVTTSICCVSRATILTGQHMARHKIDRFGVAVKDFSQTYPALLRKSGYWTGFVGKFGVGKIEDTQFDFARAYEGVHWMKDARGERIHVTEKNLRDSMEFLQKRPADQPFCLSVSFFAPHAEDRAPEQYLPQPESEALYRDTVIPIPKTATAKHLELLPPFLSDEKNEGRVRYKKRFNTPEKYQLYMKEYYRLVSEVDAAIGKLIDELKAQKVYDDTLILFIADNGYFHGERGLADKWYPYEEALRVPLIVRDPSLPKQLVGTTNDSFVLNLDVATTLLAAAGISTPPSMQGEPLQKLYAENQGAETKPRESFYYEHPIILGPDRIPRSEAVIERQWRYHYWPDFEFEELYNLSDDPHQETNLGNHPDHATQLIRLRKELPKLRAAAAH